MTRAVFSALKQPVQVLSPTWSLTRFLYLAFFVVASTYAALLGYRWSLIKGKRILVSLDEDEEEFELERESIRQGGFVAGGKERQALRRMLGRNASKRASVIRIVSSDPTSALCDNPMQLELDATGRRTFWPSSPSLQAPKEAIVPEKRSSSLSGSPIPSRRRKDNAARLSVPLNRSLSSSPSPSRSNVQTRPGRPRSLDATSIARTGSNASNRSKRSTATTADDEWVDNAPLPEEDDTPGSAASTPNMARAASEQSGRFASSVPDDSDSFVDFSPESSVISLQRLPSILRNQAQTFRTASLRDIDISHTLVPHSPTSPGMMGPEAVYGMMPNPFVQPSADFGGAVAPPPYSPSSFAMDRLNQSWSQARKRQVRLVEPDWDSHADSHIRARERLEAATRFSHFKRSNSVDTHLNRLADWPESPSEGDVHDPEFWFERFTQSTAAAGRDWDWRKRRARLQRAAAIGAALNQTAFGVPPHMPSADSQIKQGLSEPTLGAGQVANMARRMMSGVPVVNLNEQEVQAASGLSIDIETGRVPNSKAAVAYPSSPTPSGSGTPMGGIFSASEAKLAEAARVAQRRRRASEDAARPFTPPANAPVTSSGLSRPPMTSDSSSSSLKKGMNRVMRRKASSSVDSSAEGLAPLAGEEDVAPHPPTSLPPGVDPSARISSLGSLGRKISRNGAKRGGVPDNAGIELIDSPGAEEADLRDDDEQAAYERSLMQGQSLASAGFRSSADSYSPPASRLGFRSAQRNSDPLLKASPVLSDSMPAAYFDSKASPAPMARKDSTNSSKGARAGVKRAASKSENDSLGKSSSSTTSSQKDSVSSTASPPVIKSRVKSGSRSSIMRSSNTARTEMDHSARKRASSTTMSASSSASSVGSPPGSRPGSTRRGSPTSSMKRPREQAPDPVLQPEPAPRGMAYRARSASLSSNASSTPSGSRRSSRSSSIRDGHTPSGFAGLSLAMTSSTPGSPEGSRKPDPFSITPLPSTE